MSMHSTTANMDSTAVLARGANNFPKRHAGQFKKGDDPRRLGGAKLYGGMTLAQMARKRTPECLALLTKAMQGEDVPWPVRVRAAEILLDRGHGKAVSVVEMNVTHNRTLADLTMDELHALAAGEQPRMPITFDGEATEAAALPSNHPANVPTES
jgi:hypothetical protein